VRATNPGDGRLWDGRICEKRSRNRRTREMENLRWDAKNGVYEFTRDGVSDSITAEDLLGFGCTAGLGLGIFV